MQPIGARYWAETAAPLLTALISLALVAVWLGGAKRRFPVAVVG